MRQKWLQLRRARILGARVYVHWSVFAVVLLLALVSLRSPIYAVISIASYLAVIVIHETGHAWVARRLGYYVDAIRIGFFHGQCESDAPHSESDHVMIAWGGVLAQLAVAVPILIVAKLSGEPDFGYAGPLVGILGQINLLIALVNLAPAPVLDGHIAWRAVPLLWQWQRARATTKRSLGGLKRRR
jgi:Zn-dependent protease